MLELLRSVDITDEIMQHCIELSNKGYQLALSNAVKLTDEYERLLPYINIARINANALDKVTLIETLKKLKRWPILLLTEKVENRQTANYCASLNFQMPQGFYFSKPEIITGKRIDPSKLSLLKLLLLIAKESEASEIEKEL